MKFNIKDVKSWANRHDVKTLSVTGFFGNSLSEIDDEIKRYNNGDKDRLHELYKITDNGCYCFGYALYFADTGAFCGTKTFAFFLPLEAVKEDKPKEKKYRPIKNMRELTDVVRGKDWTTAISTDEELLVRCKYNKHRIKVLITRLEFDNNLELVLINNKAPKVLLENYEVMSVNGNFMPFGVEVEDEY